MDKLKLAHEYALEMAKQGIPLKSCKELGWKYADAMQAEADGRVNKERPDVLQEWQPDWSQSPDWANWWAKTMGGSFLWCAHEPIMNDDYFRAVVGSTPAPSFGYIGNWQDSLRKRP